MTILNILKTSGKAAVVAVVLGSSALVAMPAQAAGPGFSFSFGGGPGLPGGVQLHFGDSNYYDYCKTNRQIERSLRDYGFRDAQVVSEGNKYNKVIAVGRKGSTWYQMRVDRCSGKVDRVTPVSRRSTNNSFNITLGF